VPIVLGGAAAVLLAGGGLSFAASNPAGSCLTALLCLGQPAPDRMTFRNNLLAGHLTRHEMTRVTTRTSHRRKYDETLVYRQRSEMLQCNIEEPMPTNAMAYVMLVDKPAEVVRVSRDKKKVKPAPPAENFNLPGGSTRLLSVNITPTDAPVQAPTTTVIERAVLTPLLDFAHWPAQRVEAGHRWQRDVTVDGFIGTQTFEFVDLVSMKNDTAARLTMFVEGRFTGPLERDYVFEKGQAIIHWSRTERTVLKMEAQALYQQRRENGPEDYKLKLDVALAGVDMLDEAALNVNKDQMIVFAEALKKQRTGSRRDALAICNEFRNKWPKSMWMPAVAELAMQLAPQKTESKTYSDEELKDLVAKSVVAYEASRKNFEYDLQEKTRAVLFGLADEYYSRLQKLSRDKDEDIRGGAVFTIAFASRPAAMDVVLAAARDPSPKVKAMALAGLAARRSPETSTELLSTLLDDPHVEVRQRACEAVAACVPPDHFAVAGLVSKLDHLMIFDDSAAVRLAAVRAIAAIGGPADAPRFDKALTHELDRGIREEIRRALERVQANS
jgi:hypothetical protein